MAFAVNPEALTKECKKRNAEACFNLGWMYTQGTGVRQSDDEALKLYGRACDLKNKRGVKATRS